ncbi:MAG: 3-deoxy-8-phosphooctulonate synthase [Cytophagales bacterium]|nr:3-deoxy-8-phosphooctulonate synthase [Cytophagales bacterium]MDW8385357.1 3-deoxy-8-phosphooctulonate synthase [Flammeovirgaceae bacterium]
MNLYKTLQEVPFVIAGPCVIESAEMAYDLAENISQICRKVGFAYVFKASFDKANRTSLESFRGYGLEKGLQILSEIKQRYQIPVTTDVHESVQVPAVASVVDIVQIPAFLCRQTDLLLAAGKSGKIVNVKKAQFLSAADMKNVIKKLESTQNQQIILTERGTMFGYNNLIVDFTGVVEMQTYGYPVVMDATHSVQKPGGLEGKSGGNRKYAPHLANAAAAVGVRGFFFEVHRNPEQALSDGPNMIFLDDFENVLTRLKKFVDVFTS